MKLSTLKVRDNRQSKSYKVNEDIYKAAMLRAGKNEAYLANIVENVVISYALGLDVSAYVTSGNKTDAIDIFSFEAPAIVDAIQKIRKENKLKK